MKEGVYQLDELLKTSLQICGWVPFALDANKYVVFRSSMSSISIFVFLFDIRPCA